ncbi:MAG: 50S ribosomal protein L23 [Candidatus Nanohaloarchaea archaeon]|nr:50S ribosomal protein L23 [Candidatus Nanohaloarchaea archaeon]
MDKRDWDIIKHPHLTEKSVGKVDEDNTLVFIVDERANKPQIQGAVENLFDVGVDNVNTQVTQDGEKKAYVRLTPDYEALDVATQLGML